MCVQVRRRIKKGGRLCVQVQRNQKGRPPVCAGAEETKREVACERRCRGTKKGSRLCGGAEDPEMMQVMIVLPQT